MSVIETQGFKLDSSGKRVVVDPVTRIEGHLRVEVNLNADNVISNAVSTGTMWRGLEVILKGRYPRDAWAFVERICGVCTGVHALASVRAVEHALKIQIPDNANIIRNLMHATLYAHDHLVHFYQLHALDWVDVISALKADPKKTSELAQSISPWPNSSPGYYRDLLARLTKFASGGQLGPFKNGYWGNPAFKLPPEANLMAVAHYLEALDFQREIVKIQTVFGGKNPHPNWLVGGVPCSLNVNEIGAVGAINMESLNRVGKIVDDTIAFIDQVYIPDLLAIASFYKDQLWGGGISGQNVMTYGEFPDIANDDSNKSLMMPRGAILNGNLKEILPIDAADPALIQEYVNHSWYKYPDESKGLHPWDGVTDPNFVLGPGNVGTKTNIEWLGAEGKYSWIKAPRFKGQPMEVGPLARYIVYYAMGIPEFKEPVDKVLKDLGLPLTAIFSTLGRTAARGLEASWAAHKMKYFFDKLMANLRNGNTSTANIANWNPSTWPAQAKGYGLVEAPRGALGHWTRIRNTRIDLYQCIVPTTWNGGPRDPKNQIGAFEASLMNTKVAVADQPVEILRTLHSFDPCLACATHVISPEGEEVARVSVR
ncbi:MAG: nickel-dependent hydrogenase large subunit [Betaproteobacteria bacterium]